MSRVQVPLLTPRRTAGRTPSGLRFAVPPGPRLCPTWWTDVAGSSPVTHPKRSSPRPARLQAGARLRHSLLNHRVLDVRRDVGGLCDSWPHDVVGRLRAG